MQQTEVNRAKITKQLSYYFSDANFSNDKFLHETATKNGGKVPITILLTFKKMKEMGATKDMVVDCLPDVTGVELVEDEFIKKLETDEFIAYKKSRDALKRSLFISNIPTACELDDIYAILNDKGVTVLQVRMRRTKEKVFNGTCFVEFKTVEDANTILSLDNTLEMTPPISKVEDGDKTGDENLEEEKVVEESAKRVKTTPVTLRIITKQEYLKQNSADKVKDGEAEAIAKIKKDFAAKLYHIKKVGDGQKLDIQSVKAVVKNASYVDIAQNVVRMKYIEDWQTKEFMNDKEEVEYILTKMTAEETTVYLSTVNIRAKKNKTKK